MMLSLRLSTLVDMVPPNRNVADVGSDHCLLPIALARRGDVGFLQAIDNKMGPYQAMEEAVRKENLSDRIELSLSDGLHCLDERCDTIVLAGMGGKLAVRILQEGQDHLSHVDTILTDAHRDLEYSRRRIVELGYYIEEERVVEEGGIFYFLMRFQKGEAPSYSKEDWFFGPIARRKREKPFVDFLLAQKKRLQLLLTQDLTVEVTSAYQGLLAMVNAELSRRWR